MTEFAHHFTIPMTCCISTLTIKPLSERAVRTEQRIDQADNIRNHYPPEHHKERRSAIIRLLMNCDRTNARSLPTHNQPWTYSSLRT